MDIDLGKGLLDVKFKGHKYELREPTLDDVKAFQDDKDKEKSMYNFIVSLGMPEGVAKEMGIFALKRFSDQLLKPLNEKK